MIVVDASVLVTATVDCGAEGNWAETTLSGRRLVAPHLVLVEATSALSKLERTGVLAAPVAAAAAARLTTLPLDLVSFEPFASRVWELRNNLSAYDAWYVAIAEVIGAPLATLDRRLAAAPGPRCDFLVPARA